MLRESRILITGGTGSLGRELARTLCEGNEVAVYSRNEERQYLMQKEFRGKPVEFFIGDVRDQGTLENALAGCDLAIHAAAMKDLIMCQNQPTQTCLNNIVGSRSFIQAVRNTTSVKKACAVSTDKAASPSSVYGSSKYIMEQLFLEGDRFSQCIFSSVRFGNMIDSSGSLVSDWKKNPEQKIKLTHMDASRFFFTVKDAADTVIKAIELSSGGEIFIRKMKKARIFDILKIITGREEFQIIGLFPGEKVHEELLGPAELPYCHDIGDYYVIRHDEINPKPPEMLSTANAEGFTMDELRTMIDLVR